MSLGHPVSFAAYHLHQPCMCVWHEPLMSHTHTSAAYVTHTRISRLCHTPIILMRIGSYTHHNEPYHIRARQVIVPHTHKASHCDVRNCRVSFTCVTWLIAYHSYEWYHSYERYHSYEWYAMSHVWLSDVHKCLSMIFMTCVTAAYHS